MRDFLRLHIEGRGETERKRESAEREREGDPQLEHVSREGLSQASVVYSGPEGELYGV